MKKNIISIIIVAVIILGFTVGGFGINQSSNSISTPNNEKALALQFDSPMVAFEETTHQDNPIISWYTIISLGAGVIGIAIFRRNTFA